MILYKVAIGPQPSILAASKRDKSTYAHGFKRTNEQKEKIRNGLLRYYANVSNQS